MSVFCFRCEYFIWVESGQDAIRLGGNVTAREVSTQEVPLVTLRFCYSANLDRGKNTAHIQRWKAAFAILGKIKGKVLNK